MESLWLLAVGLVPVVFGPAELTAFVDVPKVAALRVLTGAIALLWITEWAFFGSGLRRIHDWRSPAAWMLIAGALFLAANAASTLLSAAPGLSLWGGVPGGDGYGLYNMASYFILFFTIGTRARTMGKLVRLLGVVALSATLSAFYGVLQHHGIDPLGESNRARVPSSFGNPLFAGSFLAMSVPLTLGVVLARARRGGARTLIPRIGVAGWLGVLGVGVQLTALAFTLSRGPWVGLIAGLGVLLVLTWTVGKWRLMVQTGVVMVAAGVLALLIMVAPDLTRNRVASNGAQDYAPAMAASDASSLGSMLDRAGSIGPQLSSGVIGNRASLWRRAVTVAVERPWVSPQAWWSDLARHFFGYGPDLFLYTLPLAFDPSATELVNASAHGYFLQVWVELGILGLVIYTGFILALMLGGLLVLRRDGKGLGPEYRVVLVALLATVAVRLVEQLTGVARVSDMALFWTVSGAIVATMSMDRTGLASTDRQGVGTGRARSTSIWRIAVTAPLVLAGVALIWDKNIDYVHASVLGTASLRSFEDRDLSESLERMDRAISLAPDVEFYYLARAELLNGYGARDAEDAREISTAKYKLALRALEANPLSHVARAKAADLAMELYGLGLNEMGPDAVSLYEELVSMLPGYADGCDALAFAYEVTKMRRRVDTSLCER